MSSISPIIAAIDFSPPSPFVLRHAVQAARDSGAPVHAIHVLDAGILSHLAASGIHAPSVEQLIAKAGERLRALIAAECPEDCVTVEVRKGRPAIELFRAVEEQQARLLVIAANDLTKKRLGSIASRCVRSVPCNVLVIRDWQEEAFTKLVVCTDFSATSAKALRRGIELARAHGGHLEIVHVMFPPTEDVWGATLNHRQVSEQTYQKECEAKVAAQMASALQPHQETLSTIPHQTVILQSSQPAMALTHHIEASGADLVILGTRCQTGLTGRFIGTNAERLLQDATVSVLGIRD